MLNIVNGRNPFRLFKETSKYVSTVNAPISEGILLLNRQFTKQSLLNLVRKPICVGRDDVSE
jgi:hypothetical protein